MAADLAVHELRGIAQASRLRLQGGCTEEARGHPQRFREGEDAGLVRLEVDREHPGHRFRGEAGPVQAGPGEGRNLVRRRAALATDAEGEAAGVVDEGVRRPRGLGVVHPDRESARVVDGEIASVQPRDPGGNPYPRPVQEGGGEGFAVLGIGERPALGRAVEGDAETPVARAGERGARPDGGSDAPGEVDPAAMRPEEGHCESPVFGNRDHRRLRTLVAEDRRQRPHQDSGRAHPHDGPPRLEERAQVARRLGERPVRVRDAPAQSVHFGIAERAGNPAREPAALRGESEGGDAGAHFHAVPRRCTSTIEK